MLDLSKLRVAIVHEWFVDYSGSERVVEQMINIFPHADLFAQVEYLPDHLKSFIHNKTVHTSFIQKLPFAKSQYRNYLPLMPLAVEQFDVSEYDLIISSSHAVAKGVITGPDQIHISYVHSPIRYAWDLTHQYLREAGLDHNLRGWITRLILHYIRNWDTRTSNGVDYFCCNSHYISRRIRKVYGRDSSVVYPPVDTDYFELQEKKGDYYLTVSRLVPYKKVDIIVEAFSKMPDKNLIVIGDGPQLQQVKQFVADNITLMGYQSNDVVKTYMQRAKAFIFAAVEDFGIVPLEAQACGTPVIAYGKGGVLETVIENETGLFFYRQHPDDIVNAVRQFESRIHSFDPVVIRNHSVGFSKQRFKKEFKDFVVKAVHAHHTHSVFKRKEDQLDERSKELV